MKTKRLIVALCIVVLLVSGMALLVHRAAPGSFLYPVKTFFGLDEATPNRVADQEMYMTETDQQRTVEASSDTIPSL